MLLNYEESLSDACVCVTGLSREIKLLSNAIFQTVGTANFFNTLDMLHSPESTCVAWTPVPAPFH